MTGTDSIFTSPCRLDSEDHPPVTTFEHCGGAMPRFMQAELIEGVVDVGSPVKSRKHGNTHGRTYYLESRKHGNTHGRTYYLVRNLRSCNTRDHVWR